MEKKKTQPVECTQIDMSWTDVEDSISTLLGQFKEANYTPKNILAVAKGGVIPATLIHQAFPSALFHCVQVKSYEEFFQQEAKMVGDIPFLLNEPLTLVVDDILETGTTRDKLQTYWPLATYAFMVCRYSMADQCEYRGKIYGSGWINFPWEKKIEAAEIPF